MNLTNVKTEKQRVEVVDGLSLGIQNYGLKNDYPQKIKTVTSASVTAKGCISTYQKFMQGGGFLDTVFYKEKVNSKGLTCDQLLNLLVKDIADYGGFAVHVNYNVLGVKTDVTHVPFEHCRFQIEDETGNFAKIALHRDWTKLKRLTRVSKETITFIDKYNPIKSVIQAQIEAAGGIDNYKGQIYYFSLDGDMVYPKPIYDSAITDISTEAGISNVIYRNTRMNFLPAGMLIRKKAENSGNVDEYGRPVVDTFPQSFKQFQGDENACKIIDVEIEFEEESPEFVPFTIDQYVVANMKVSTEITSSKIGKAFLQPPILRMENVATGFTLQAMQDAYEYYNTITISERLQLERIFTEIFTNFERPINPTNNYSIIPLKYGQPDNGNGNTGTV